MTLTDQRVGYRRPIKRNPSTDCVGALIAISLEPLGFSTESLTSLCLDLEVWVTVVAHQ